MLRNIVLIFCLGLLCPWAEAGTLQENRVKKNTSGDASPLERLIQQADQEFNAGQYQTARENYQQAGQQVQGRGREQFRCELLNNLAAAYMAQNDLANFYRYFHMVKECNAALAKVPIQATSRAAPGNLLINGGFEDGLIPPWGSGHYETSAGRTRFGIWWNSNNARAFMKVDTDQHHSGKKSLRITNYSPPAPHVFTTTSQRITGLTPNTVYRLSLYAKAENLQGGVNFAVDAAWGKRPLSLPAGTYDWRQLSATINIGHNDYIDFRIIQENTGTIWLDDIVIEPVEAPGGIQGMLQQAESRFDKGQFQEALAIYRELEEKNPDNKGILFQTRHQGGRIQLVLGEYEQALQSFTWLADNGFQKASLDLGDLYYQLGDFDKADGFYQKALKTFVGDQGTYSLVQDRVAGNFLAQGKLDQALAAQQNSLHILRHIGDQHGQAVALNTLGMIFMQQQNLSQAQNSFAAAVQLARQLDDKRLLANILNNQGETAYRSERLQEARGYVKEALSLGTAIHDPRVQVQSFYLQGRLNRRAGELPKAGSDFRQAVALLHELYGQLGQTSRETRQAFLGQFTDLYRDYTDLLLELYQLDHQSAYGEEAFRVSEQARARLFTEMINEVRAAQAFAGSTKDPELARLLVRERQTRLQLDAIQNQRAHFLERPPGQRQPQILEELDKQQAGAEEESRQLRVEISRQYPRYADLKNPQLLNYKDVQALLHPQEVVLSYFVTPQRTGVWAISADRVRLAVVPLSRAVLEERTRPLTETLPAVAQALGEYLAVPDPSARDEARIKESFERFDLNAAHEIYQTLVTPVAEVLQEKRQVFLAPDDVLYQLPFEALLTNPAAPGAPPEPAALRLVKAPYWVRTQNLSYLPSVSVLRSLRTLTKIPPVSQKPLLAFADPVFEEEATPEISILGTRSQKLQRLRDGGALPPGTLSRLPETADEAKRALQALGGSESDLYLRGRATEHNLKKLPLQQYRTVLFATHGLLAGEFRPGIQPALVLSFIGDPDNDGLLEMGEILGLDLKSDLLVLSACNTGRSFTSKDRGEGFAGLTRSFMYAGADSLIVTLWSVESSSAARLMGDFYAGLQTKAKPDALAAAKQAMIAAAQEISMGPGLKVTTAHPFFWAPYILVGEVK
jgi:CHAT domain-containing protein/tetratricopeptide (TPR) repeat protein